MCSFVLLFTIICIPIVYCILTSDYKLEYYSNYLLEIVALVLEGASSLCDIAISQLLQIIIVSKLLEIILSSLWIVALCIYHTVVSCHQRIYKNIDVPKQDVDVFTISHFLANQITDDSIKIIERNKEEMEPKITIPVVFSKSSSDLTLNELRGYSDEKLNEERPNASDKLQVSAQDVLITLQTSTDSTKSERQAIHNIDINKTSNTFIPLTSLTNGHPQVQKESTCVSMSSLCTDIFSSALNIGNAASRASDIDNTVKDVLNSALDIDNAVSYASGIDNTVKDVFSSALDIANAASRASDIDNVAKESISTCATESIEGLTSYLQLNKINVKNFVNNADVSKDSLRVIHSNNVVDPQINLAYQSYNQIFIVKKSDAASGNTSLRMSFRKRVRHRLNRFFTHLNCVKPNVQN